MTQITKKSTKKNFEQELIKTLGIEDLSMSSIKEEGKTLSLYYYKDYHIGTWGGSGVNCWTYDFENDMKEIEEQAELQNKLLLEMSA